MADQNQNQTPKIKKDQFSVRETMEELNDELPPSGTEPRLKQPNRDRARGDWDRSHGPTSK